MHCCLWSLPEAFHLLQSQTAKMDDTHLSLKYAFICCRHTIFDSYLFNGHDGEHLLALGLGSLFNHSNQPNLDYHVEKMEKVSLVRKLHIDKWEVLRSSLLRSELRCGVLVQTVTFRASRDIASGEEITFYYGSNLWFDNEEPLNLTDNSLSHDHMDDEDLVLSSIAL